MTLAIVTGGSSGIGLQCAKTLNPEGCSVVLVAKNPERAIIEW